MRGRGPFCFVAFDLLAVNGRDVRKQPLVERKEILREIVPKESRSVLYAKHVPGRGRELFGTVCEADLEGIVAKWKDAPYNPASLPLSWIKVKNRSTARRGIGPSCSSDRLSPSTAHGWPLRTTW